MAASSVRRAERDAKDDQNDRRQPKRAKYRANIALRKVTGQPDRNCADNDLPAHPRVGVAVGNLAAKSTSPLTDYARDIVPEIDQYRHFRADLRNRREGRPGIGR